MSFFAILFALLIEQVRPLARNNPIHASLRAWARWSSRNFDAGKPQHGWIAWAVAVVGPALAASAVHWALLALVGWPAAIVWSVAVLYVTLGFRQFSHHFTGIRDALDAGDEDRARELLAQWQQVDASELPRREIVRHVIEYSVLAAHRHVFGVLAWFSVLAALGCGPGGAVLYRMGEFVTRYWRHRSRVQAQPVSDALQSAAMRAWGVIDWLPARITALFFAVGGSFEERSTAGATTRSASPTTTMAWCWPPRPAPSTCAWAARRCARPSRRRRRRASARRRWSRRPPAPARARRGARPNPRTCAASWAWSGAPWCCGWCCWPC